MANSRVADNGASRILVRAWGILSGLTSITEPISSKESPKLSAVMRILRAVQREVVVRKRRLYCCTDLQPVRTPGVTHNPPTNARYGLMLGVSVADQRVTVWTSACAGANGPSAPNSSAKTGRSRERQQARKRPVRASGRREPADVEGAGVRAPAGRRAHVMPLAAGRWPLAAGRWPLAAGRWPLAAGRWPLAAGRWPLAAGRWPLAAGRWPLAAGRWPLAAGRWPLAAGRWPLAAGRWPLAAGRWPLAAGRWPLAAGRWPLAAGRWQIIHAQTGGRCQAPTRTAGGAHPRRRTVAAPVRGAAPKGRRESREDVRRVRTLESHGVPRYPVVWIGQAELSTPL